jgi:hypothetical protein
MGRRADRTIPQGLPRRASIVERSRTLLSAGYRSAIDCARDQDRSALPSAASALNIRPGGPVTLPNGY